MTLSKLLSILAVTGLLTTEAMAATTPQNLGPNNAVPVPPAGPNGPPSNAPPATSEKATPEKIDPKGLQPSASSSTGGVITPPATGDSSMQKKPPQQGTMPVIKPAPGTQDVPK
jgi:hypothetical protein